MAKPDCDDGWVKLAHELHAALSCAGFNKWESVVIREVLHQVYGPAKKREAILSPTDIATRVGTFKESIVRAIRSLKAGGVLRETETGVRFIKDYEAWTWQGNPRLTPSERAYCRAARPSNASVKPGNESVPVASTECGNESVLPSTESGNESAPVRERIGSPSGTKALPAGNESAPRAHYEERAGLRIKKEERRGEFAPACEGSVSKAGTPEADRVANLAAEVGGDISWSLWAVNRFKMGDQPRIIEAAISEAVNAGKVNQQYVAGIAARLAKEGLPTTPSYNGKAPAPPRALPPERRASIEDEARAARDTAAMKAKYGQPKAAS